MREDELDELKISDKVRQKLKNKQWVKDQLAEGKTAQEILGFTDQAMGKFYNAAYHLFDHRRYQDAAHAFFFLATLNPYDYDYWVGLGMSLQLLSDFEAAIDAYEMAAICQYDSPVPYFYLAKCLFAIHDRESAQLALDLAIEYSQTHPHYEELYEQALKAKDLLEHMGPHDKGIKRHYRKKNTEETT